MKKQISIEGMSCGHCIKHIEGAMAEIPEVTKTEVNLQGKYAVVELKADVADSKLKEAIEEAGYDVVGITNI